MCSGVRHIRISDHSIVFVYRKSSIEGISSWHNAITYRNFREFKIRINFRNDIVSQCWVSDIHFNNTLQQCSFLSSSIDKMRVCTRGSPWFKKRMHDQNTLKIKDSKSNDPCDWKLTTQYSKYGNQNGQYYQKCIVLASTWAILERPGRLTMNFERNR